MTRTLQTLILAAAMIPAAANDLPLFGLKGPVETLTIQYSSDEGQWDTCYAFDPQGRLTQVENVAVEATRDGRGRILTYTDQEEDEDGEPLCILTTITYNDDSTAASTLTGIGQNRYPDTYTYDESGRLTRHVSQAPDEDGEIEEFTFTYTYEPQTDAHGNWLVRYESSDMPDPPVHQTRVITYRNEE